MASSEGSLPVTAPMTLLGKEAHFARAPRQYHPHQAFIRRNMIAELSFKSCTRIYRTTPLFPASAHGMLSMVVDVSPTKQL